VRQIQALNYFNDFISDTATAWKLREESRAGAASFQTLKIFNTFRRHLFAYCNHPKRQCDLHEMSGSCLGIVERMSRIGKGWE